MATDRVVATFGPIFEKVEKSIMKALGFESREDVLASVKKTPRIFGSLRDEFRIDREIVLAAATKDGMIMEHASEEHQDDKEIVLKAIANQPHALQFASPRLREIILGYGLASMDKYMGHDEKTVLAAVLGSGLALEYATEDFKSNKRMVLTAVRKVGKALQFASENLRKDPEVVLAAIRSDNEDDVACAVETSPCILEFTPQDAALPPVNMRQNGLLLEYACGEAKQNKEVVLEAIRESPSALQFASPELRMRIGNIGLGVDVWKGDDREIVLAACSLDGLALEYVSTEFQNDPAIVNMAMRTTPNAIQFASDWLKTDRATILTAVSLDGNTLEFACKELQNDKDVVMRALQESPKALQFASSTIRNLVKEFNLESSNEWRGNKKDVVLSAVSKNGHALQFAADELKKDHSVVTAAIQRSPDAIQFASEDIRLMLKEVGLSTMDTWIGTNRKAALAAVTQNGLALEFVSEELRGDHPIVLAAIKQNELAREFVCATPQIELDELYNKLVIGEVPECFHDLIVSDVDNVTALDKMADEDLQAAGWGRGHIKKFRAHFPSTKLPVEQPKASPEPSPKPSPKASPKASPSASPTGGKKAGAKVKRMWCCMTAQTAD